MTNSADQRVLVVDDEESIRWVLKRGLEREGYDVSTATDGEEAIELALVDAAAVARESEELFDE